MKKGTAEENDLNGWSLEDVDKYVSKHEGMFLQKTDNRKAPSKEICYKILKDFGTLSDRKNAPRFCLVNWGGCVRYDVRRWNDDMTVPRKGITFTEQELQLLLECFRTIDIYSLGNVITAHYNTGKVKATIYENLVILSENQVSEVAWRKEANMVDWGYGIKVDFRKWSDNYCKCSKGISISLAEFSKLVELIQSASVI